LRSGKKIPGEGRVGEKKKREKSSSSHGEKKGEFSTLQKTIRLKKREVSVS